ncbi:MAG: TspO/MBR family protein [Candidatus Woesearchaeota archaeon]
MIVWYKLIISILVCLGIGTISGLFTASSIDSWYSKLNKPSFNPPNYIFGPVWTILYIMMGVALYFLWQSNNKFLITLFMIQLVMNFFWSLIFFRLQNPLLAFIDIILLLITIIIITIYSYSISKTVTYLMIPYCLWVIFASVLNLYIYILNR